MKQATEMPAALMHRWTGWKQALLASVVMGLALLAGCSSEEAGPCDGITCERGVCQAGQCVNADDCGGDDTKCSEGFRCTDANACEPAFPCGEGNTCERGVCQGGACVDPEACESNSDCVPSSYCADDDTCQDDPCFEKTCDEGGVCETGTGECINKDVCTEATESEDCVDGFLCYDARCMNEEQLCGELACARGVCDFEAKTCANADDCEGDDARCLAGDYCAEDGTCQENKCYVATEMNDRRDCPGGGVCDPATDVCVNPQDCTASEDCLPMFWCISGEDGATASCEESATACGEVSCPGNQLCEYDEQDLSAACQEDAAAGCANALDCSGDRICVRGACQDPGPNACVADPFEPNDTVAEATSFQVAAPGGLLTATICPGDSGDFYTFDTGAVAQVEGTMVIRLDVAAADVGAGILTLELLDADGNAVASMVRTSELLSTGQETPNDGARLEFAIDATNRGVYTIRVTGDSTLIAAGVRYTLAVDVGDSLLVAACQAPEELIADTPLMNNSLSGASQGLRASCADPSGEVPEDLYTFTLTQASLVDLTVTPEVGGGADLSVSLRRDCLIDSSEVACAEAAGDEGTEALQLLLNPGTYVVAVQAKDDQVTGGPYTIGYTATAATCTSAANTCKDATTALVCSPTGDMLQEVACPTGVCDQQRGECERSVGDVCYRPNQPQITPGTPFVETIDWGTLTSDYDPGPGACGRAGGLSADGPDAAYQIQVPANHVLVADLSSAASASLYAVTDCDQARFSCRAGQPASEGRLILFNDTANPQDLFLVADAAAGAHGSGQRSGTLQIEPLRDSLRPRPSSRCDATVFGQRRSLHQRWARATTASCAPPAATRPWTLAIRCPTTPAPRPRLSRRAVP